MPRHCSEETMRTSQDRRPVELRFPLAFHESLEAYSLFSADHVRFTDRLDALVQVLTEVQEKYDGSAVLGVLDDNIVCGAYFFPTRERSLILLKELFDAANVQQLRFSGEVEPEEVVTLFNSLLVKMRLNTTRDVAIEIREAGVRHITCEDALQPTELATTEAEHQSLWELVRPLDDTVYREVFETIKALSVTVIRREIPSAYPIRRAVELLVTSMTHDADSLMGLVFRPRSESWMVAHAVRSCIIALRLGIELTDDATTLHRLAESMLLNDIGLFAVPSSILNKPGQLTDSEQEEIRSHSIKGAAILLSGAGFAPSSVEAALLHHADHHGTGYPTITATTNPSIVCKIVRIVDAYDSMIGGRPYRAPLPPLAAAAELLRKAGSCFDKALVGRFIKTVGLAPVGSLAVLSDGTVGEVIKHNPEDLLRPTIRPILDATGSPLTEREPIDLTGTMNVKLAETIPLAPSVEFPLEFKAI